MRVYAELQSKQRAAYANDEAAREAAGKAALLCRKKLLAATACKTAAAAVGVQSLL